MDPCCTLVQWTLAAPLYKHADVYNKSLLHSWLLYKQISLHSAVCSPTCLAVLVCALIGLVARMSGSAQDVDGKLYCSKPCLVYMQCSYAMLLTNADLQYCYRCSLYWQCLERTGYVFCGTLVGLFARISDSSQDVDIDRPLAPLYVTLTFSVLGFMATIVLYMTKKTLAVLCVVQV